MLGRGRSTSIRVSAVSYAAFYNGMRKDMKERALILARDAYPGAQHNGAIFWSSDISPTWDVLKRQVPTGLILWRRGCRIGARTLGDGRTCRVA
jgi:alpha-glucosidase (family GH31 glycosyl hydrolase)